MSSTSNFVFFLADHDPKLVQLVAGTTQAFPGLAWAMTAVRNRGAPPLAVAFMFLTVVHVIETGKFVAPGLTTEPRSLRSRRAINPTRFSAIRASFLRNEFLPV